MADISDFKRRGRASIEAGRKAGYEAVRKEAKEIALAIRRAAPHGSGKLQESVRLETVEAKARVYIKAGGPTTTEHGYDYALGTEWGTVKTPAQPFFYPMWRLHRRTARSRINKAVKDAVNNAWAGG